MSTEHRTFSPVFPPEITTVIIIHNLQTRDTSDQNSLVWQQQNIEHEVQQQCLNSNSFVLPEQTVSLCVG